MVKLFIAVAACVCVTTAANAQVYVIKPGPPQLNWGAADLPDFAGNAMRAMAEGQAMAAARQAQAIQAQQAQQQQAQSQADFDAQQAAGYTALRQGDLRKLVGSLSADGNCDGARTEALRAGDFDLAKQVTELCKPAP